MIAMRSAFENGKSTGKAGTEQFERLTAACEKNAFVCPRCVKCPSDMIASVNIKISELISQNSWLELLVPVSSYKILMNTKIKLWRRMLQLKSVHRTVPEIMDLQSNGFEVHRPNAVVEEIIHTLSKHSGVETCHLCASDVPSRSMVDACGNCQNRICMNCSRDWYSMSKAGGVVTHVHTVCPFCKNTPKHRLVRNVTLGYIRNVRPKEGRVLCAWDAGMIHALCQDCMLVKEFCERECTREDPDIHNFRCEACRVAKLGSVRTVDVATKVCPKCTIAVEKIGGCNHMNCACGSHWCWHCGRDKDDAYGTFDEITVYDHMSNCGGVFPIDHDIEEDD